MSSTLTAGRELDALVAKRVMGIDVFEGCQGPAYLAPGLNGCKVAVLVPHYSTDIAAAWKVVEHFDFWDIRKTISGLYVADLRMKVNGSIAGYDHGHSEAPTAPLAICLAALEAVGGAQ